MTLQLASVVIMTALVVNVSGILFIVETLLRRDVGAGRIWALGFLAAMLTTLAYTVWAQSVGGWWAIAVGNAAFVAGTPALAKDKPTPPMAGNGQGPLQSVQLLSFNDYHGHLEATDGPLSKVLDPSQTAAGGVEHLATALETLRKDAPKGRSLTVAAGDLIGGSPFLSGLFHDEPSVESLNAMHLDVSSVGNHEFDEGTTELLRMQNGGCHPVDGCYFPNEPYAGADTLHLVRALIDEHADEQRLPLQGGHDLARYALVAAARRARPEIEADRVRARVEAHPCILERGDAAYLHAHHARQASTTR